MAIAPDGGCAVSNMKNNWPLKIEGRAYDPFGDVWHWTGRQPYQPATSMANMLLQHRAPDWSPTDAEAIAATLGITRMVRLAEDPALDVAQRVAATDGDPYLMAVACAKAMMRNLYNGTTTATLSDDSKAYLDPSTRAVTPA